ncbi:MAG: macro domain-containing protein [Oscillospiraceae bacterium]|nr:macro domain-containing protein [Oscillospiraceae bacterium]
MINFVTGNLFDSDAYALVNTVNCEGYMGKGIAYQFRLRYPEMNKEYVSKCKSHQLKPGTLHTFNTGAKLIINFPTKDKWRANSKMEYITSGLDALINLINEHNIKSIAIPPLGSGNGGLIWNEVKEVIIQKLSCFEENVTIYVYEPSQNYKATPVAEPKLSLSALILMKIKFSLLPDKEHFSNIGLQKTAYFMNVLSNTEYFHFTRGQYGPYTHDIEIIAKNIKEFELYHRVKSTNEAYDILMQKLISAQTIQKIEFFSPFIEKAAEFSNSLSGKTDIEGAGTALYLIQEKGCANTDEIINGFKTWSDDKAKRFSEESILSAIYELENAGFIEKNFCGYQITC